MSLAKVLFLGAAIGFALPTFAVADIELVTNGGFETGDFPGWTQVGNSGFAWVLRNIEGVDPASGSYQVFFEPVGSTWGIAQNLATTAGQAYTVAFDLYNYGGEGTSYQAFWGATPLFPAVIDSAPFVYTHFSFTVVGTGTDSTTLTFQNDRSWFLLDNVSVTAPEPDVYAVLALGLAGLIIGVCRRKIA